MRDSFRFALDFLLSNRRRAMITVAIITVGVSALVGIQTALDVMAEKVVGSFNRMGTGLCTVRPLSDAPPLTLHQAAAFCREMEEDGSDAVEATLWTEYASSAQVRSGGVSTDPVVRLLGCDANYLACNGASVARGRGFSERDVEDRARIALLGDNVRRKLFGDGDGLGEWVSCSAGRYRVVGIVERQGALFGRDLDGSLLIPPDGGGSGFNVTLRIPAASQSAVAAMAGRRMAAIRRLSPGAEPDFEIVRADSSEEMLASLRGKLSLAALVIGLITMLGAATGLMNSMLVSVKERTREIGTSRALGATTKVIERQFLAESVLIGQAGCLAGVLLGMFLGNLVAWTMEGDFVVPWTWIGFSVLLSLAVSLAAGLLPARRAAALDPIQALR